MAILRIYTDGACSGNQHEENVGGWGAILEFAGHKKELCGGEINTTNNRMEMTALLEALRALKKPAQNIEVYSDSSYLMNCFREKWYVKWTKNNWKNSKNEPVENREIWEALLPFLDVHSFDFYRVKGHVSTEWHLSQTNDHGKSLAALLSDLQCYPEPCQNAEVNLPPSLQKTFSDFCKWNGSRFSPLEFLYITKMNNRADRLANIGMDEFRY